uniref:Uncharacterized protein n=1 Tax=Brassica oleracea TaxID=3712 RepID=A0A3P6EP39_BRAOL|nr:unnamed protein product [Brassica oleracea]
MRRYLTSLHITRSRRSGSGEKEVLALGGLTMLRGNRKMLTFCVCC